MGSQRVVGPGDAERKILAPDHVENLAAAASATNEDLSWSDDDPRRYGLDTAQAEALLVHTRQDAAAAYLQTVAIMKAVAQNNTFIRRIQIGILVVIALQVAQLSGCHWG